MEGTFSETKTRLEQELVVVRGSREKAEQEVKRLEARNLELISEVRQAKVRTIKTKNYKVVVVSGKNLKPGLIYLLELI